MLNYEEYLEQWLYGVEEEISFWERFISLEGGDYFYAFEKTVDSCRCFELEEDIPYEKYGTEYSFVDIGSGPFSRCGKVTEKVNLHAISVDPLADVYNALKEKYGVDNGVHIETGFVELLEYKFDQNSFDMVHMSNSLDHCFSAIDGLWQLLYICKVGGKIVLRHHENEAEKEKYLGLHQWNLSLHNEENSFIIWRGDIRYDIRTLFQEYADIDLFPDIQEKGGQWIYNKVVLTKKKCVSLGNNPYYQIFFNKLYQKLLSSMSVTTLEKRKRESNDKDRYLGLIKDAFHNLHSFKKAIEETGICSVAVYGLGVIGKNLVYLLEQAGVYIKYYIDKNGKNCGHQSAICLSELEMLDVDLVIVTVLQDVERVCKQLSERTNNNVWSLESFFAYCKY